MSEQITDKTETSITFQDIHCCVEQVRVCVVGTQLVVLCAPVQSVWLPLHAAECLIYGDLFLKAVLILFHNEIGALHIAAVLSFGTVDCYMFIWERNMSPRRYLQAALITGARRCRVGCSTNLFLII